MAVTDGKFYSKYSSDNFDAALDAAMAALPKSGGTMTGALVLAGTPTENMHAANKDYVDGQVAEAKAAAQAAADTAAQANTAAGPAQTAAQEAQTAAQEAQTAAQEAQTAAETAASRSSNALSLANSAIGAVLQMADSVEKTKEDTDASIAELNGVVVKSINGNTPDEDGNVEIETGGAAPEGVYELIETVTLEGDMVLERTQEPDGTPYRFKEMVIKGTMTQPQTASCRMYYYYNGTNILSAYYSSSTSGTKYRLDRIEQHHGYWWISWSDWNANNSAHTKAQGVGVSALTKSVADFPYIDKIKTNGNLAKGTVIEIWGGRA